MHPTPWQPPRRLDQPVARPGSSTLGRHDREPRPYAPAEGLLRPARPRGRPRSARPPPGPRHPGRPDHPPPDRGRGLRRRERPRLARVSRSHRPQRGDVRCARPCVRLLHLRHVVLHEPGLRPRGPGERGPVARGEIVEGAELARTRRLAARNDKELAKGPARLATALDVDRSLNGTDACATGATPSASSTALPSTPARYATDRAPASPARAPCTPGGTGSRTTRRSARTGPTCRVAAEVDSPAEGA